MVIYWNIIGVICIVAVIIGLISGVINYYGNNEKWAV